MLNNSNKKDLFTINYKKIFDKKTNKENKIYFLRNQETLVEKEISYDLFKILISSPNIIINALSIDNDKIISHDPDYEFFYSIYLDIYDIMYYKLLV